AAAGAGAALAVRLADGAALERACGVAGAAAGVAGVAGEGEGDGSGLGLGLGEGDGDGGAVARTAAGAAPIVITNVWSWVAPAASVARTVNPAAGDAAAVGVPTRCPKRSNASP